MGYQQITAGWRSNFFKILQSELSFRYDLLNLFPGPAFSWVARSMCGALLGRFQKKANPWKRGDAKPVPYAGRTVT